MNDTLISALFNEHLIYRLTGATSVDSATEDTSGNGS